MNNLNLVKVGDWYLDRDKHDFLCVIGVHDEEGVIDVRDEYGDIDEIEFDEWETMDLVLCATPREWKLSDADDDFSDDAPQTQRSL
jgi:hypothetical protein